MNKFKCFVFVHVISISTCFAKQPTWEVLIDSNLSKWDTFMGVPHKSSNIVGYETIEDVRVGTPIGLNRDPKNVFSVINQNNEQVLKITGEIFAGLVTKKSYKNYHFKADFKWGNKKWAPRLNAKRNSGVLYHSVGNFDYFWNVWMRSLEFEVQETDTGDFITISEGDIEAQCPSKKRDNNYHFLKKAPLVNFAWKDGFASGRCYKSHDKENAHGNWNTIELITYEDTAIHVVNGDIVATVHNAKLFVENKWIPMREGKIQLQSEAAEVYYKNIVIKPIKQLPLQFKTFKR
jgi:hypothetical protein